MNEKIRTQEALKSYLERILNLQAAEELTPAAMLLFKLSKELLNQIGEDAGHISHYKRFVKCFEEVPDEERERMISDEVKVLDLFLEGLEWIKCDSKLWKPSLFDLGLHGDEVFYTLDFVAGEGIPEEAIERLKMLGIEVEEQRNE